MRPVLLFLITVLCLCSCAGPLYNVNPLPKNAAPEMMTSTPGSLEVKAAALSDESSFAQLGANLPMVGLVAVEVRLTNSSKTPLALAALKPALHDSKGNSLKKLAAKKALSRVMKFYRVSLYGKESYARTLESYQAIALPESGELAPSDSVMGLLFFDAKTTLTDLAGYRLTIEGGPSPVSLQLN